MDPSYSFHFRSASVSDVVDVLERASLTGVVLGADRGWATAVLPRTDDERARLARLAVLHPSGVLLYSVGPAGDRILWQTDTLLVVDALAAARLHKEGLISDVSRARLSVVSPRGHDWLPILGLPDLARHSDALLQQAFVDLPGAVSVGRDVGVPLPPPMVVRPQTGQELFELLLNTGSVELEADADRAALADAFAEQIDHGGSAAARWLLDCPDIAEVFVSDEALQAVIDEAWPEN